MGKPPSLSSAAWTAEQSAPSSNLSEADTLVQRLVEEMGDRWRKGECPGAEEFLARFPELTAQPEKAVQLIHEEMCLRQETGRDAASIEILNRFPQWRAQLEVLLDCHRLLQPSLAAPKFPEVGETWFECRLLAELGRGSKGRVFLAVQPSLADRPVVLKLTPCDGNEHVSLARLQHTHIVPLYAVQDHAGRNLRTLCMPYFGSVSLEGLLNALKEKPLGRRTGQDLLEVLDQAQKASAVQLPVQGPARQFLARASYVQAICWIGACLADALQDAHERGLVHLDVKPSNILLAVDGQPMLLDFHLAQKPLRPDGPVPEWIGGTLQYMSPEQQAALNAVRGGKAVSQVVDGRSDIYSLGLVLYEALGGTDSQPKGPSAPLHGPQLPVSVGLSDIILKCLSPAAGNRYAKASALAADLRRHLGNQPLLGVSNRSWGERWRKWRKRKPSAFYLWVMTGMLLLVCAAGGIYYLNHSGQLRREAQTAVEEGQHHLNQGEYAEAAFTFSRGLERVQGSSQNGDLAETLSNRLQMARQAQAARNLHDLVNRLRFIDGMEFLPPEASRTVDTTCRSIWESRGLLLAGRGRSELDVEKNVKTDYLDLALLWTALRTRLASKNEVFRVRREALQILDEAEALAGPSTVLYRERQAHAAALGLEDAARTAERRAAELRPRTAWEHQALGRLLFHSGKLEAATLEFDRALELQPQSVWPYFYQGLCAYHLKKFDEAVSSFRVCTALMPRSADCFYNRALAQAARKQPEQALHDYDKALQLDPALPAAYLNRGILHGEQKHFAQALLDLETALEKGADPAAVHYNEAVVHLAQAKQASALSCLRRALQYRSNFAEARELLDRLERDK